MLPTVKPLVVTALVLHATEVSPAQVPENTCTLGFTKLDPAALMVTVGLVVCATKRYQTSYFAVPPQPAGVPLLREALTTVPAVVMQEVDEVNVMAPEQRSFAGCAKDSVQDSIANSSSNSILTAGRVWVRTVFIVQVALIKQDRMAAVAGKSITA